MDYKQFLEEAAKALEKKTVSPPAGLVDLLYTYDFPGNIRELRSMIFDAVTRHKSGVLSTDSLLSTMGRTDISRAPVTSAPSAGNNIFAGIDTLPSPETAVNFLIEEALKRSKGNQSLAARMLGISQSALNKRLRRPSPRSDKA